METKNRFLEKIIIMGICIEILLMFVNRNEYFQLSGWYYPLLISVAAGILPVINKIRRIKKISVFALLFMLLIACSAIINFRMMSSGYVLSYALAIVIFFIFTEVDFEKKQLDIIAVCSSLSGIIISLMIMLFRVRYYELTSARLTIRFGSGPKIDPNYLSGYLVSMAAIPIGYSLLVEGKRLKTFFVASYIIIAFGTLLTGSRGALITLAVITFMAILDRSRKSAILFLAVIATVIVAYFLLQRFLSIDTLSRLSNISSWLSDGSNIRRISLWQNAWNSIRKSPILGYGMTATIDINAYAGNYYEPTHSTYLEMWCQLGICSIILLLLIVINILKTRNKTATWIVIATIIPAIFISAECNFYFWFNIAFAATICDVCSRNDFKNDNTEYSLY